MINLDNIKKKLGIASEEEENIFDSKINELRKFVYQKMGEYDNLGEEESQGAHNIDEKSEQEGDNTEQNDTVDGNGVSIQKQSQIDHSASGNVELGKRVLVLEKSLKAIKKQLEDLIKNKANVIDVAEVKSNFSKFHFFN